MEYEKLARKYRKRSVLDGDSLSMIKTSYGVDDIKKLLPHRDPFLLIDGIEGVDFEQQGIIGSRKIDPNDPIFQGHFPDYPIYPGVLQIEMIGQLAICYDAFAKEKTVEIDKDYSEIGIRVIKISHTLFQNEVLPNARIKIIAKVLQEDEYKIKGIGQIIDGDNICTIAIAEFYKMR
ncbi:MAG: beta-hydroxyacyl-ACP dehydratase [Proteobacteria bacterium]|nr:beta-hydroxyacyl-ACP dehydratase [Pseudomonadota bacterium]